MRQKINNWQVVHNDIDNDFHIEGRLSDGSGICTARIDKIEANVAYTRNNKEYLLGKPEKKMMGI